MKRIDIDKKIDESSVKYADIYEGVAVPKDLSGNVKKRWKKSKEDYRMVTSFIYNESMIVELANGKYADLAEMKNVIDYFILSTCAKFNIDNKRLMVSDEDQEIVHGRRYVRCVKDVYEKLSPLKDDEFKFGKMKVNQVYLSQEMSNASIKRHRDEAPYEPYFE